MKNTISRPNFNTTENTPPQTPCLWGFKRMLNRMLAEHIKRIFKINPLRPMIKLDKQYFKKNLSPFQFEMATDIFQKFFCGFSLKSQRIFQNKSFEVSGKFLNAFSKQNPLGFRKRFSKDFSQKFFQGFCPNFLTDFILKIRFGFGKISQRIFFRNSFGNSGKLFTRFIFRNSLLFQILSPTDFSK